MATVFVSRCETCGTVRLPPDAITLAVWPDLPQMSSYSFQCPHCRVIQTWAMSGLTFYHLVNGGARKKEMHLPERAPLEDVEPIDADFLQRASLTLRDHDNLIELLEGDASGDHAEEG